MLRQLAIASLLVGASVRAARAQDYKVVVNEGNPVTSVSRGDLSRLFLGGRASWASGQRAMPVDQASGRSRAAFSQEILGRDLAKMRTYWQEEMAAGRGTAPEEKPSDASVIAYVRDHSGAVGYVSASTSTPGVKVVAVAEGSRGALSEVEEEVPSHIIAAARPRYPDALRESGVDGRVVVRFVVDTLGRVDMGTVEVLQSTNEQFARSVREALPRARFAPAEAGGRRVASTIEMPFAFATARR